jgi:diaminohydroxyphosphoribosylaminopyrimidine deaminase/5-amino-6-(5-phosphoribosylamino)uracil reductase
MLINGAYRIFNSEAPTYIFGEGRSRENIHYIPAGKNLQQQVCDFAAEHNWTSLYVEGGSYTITKFLETGLWDEIRMITNTGLYLKEGIPAPDVPVTEVHDTFSLDGQMIQTFRNKAEK